jgi:hypothetical protein
LFVCCKYLFIYFFFFQVGGFVFLCSRVFFLRAGEKKMWRFIC